MSTEQNVAATIILFYIIAVVVGLIGWVMNIIALFHMSWNTFTTELVIRLVGVPVAIIGAVAGWM
ncbi:hypothetical protein [uncultured Cohaesibacter sp.]|uniref:hypothetical protein n=1 Tax=uncultured Cohaesibacter sp. TaxID=1002546 RepID=UPI0029C7E36F|nr:hypothetical protein [uncultured Cohaesibacter sp.]